MSQTAFLVCNMYVGSGSEWRRRDYLQDASRLGAGTPARDCCSSTVQLLAAAAKNLNISSAAQVVY